MNSWAQHIFDASTISLSEKLSSPKHILSLIVPAKSKGS